jgi:hypothetical protein
MATGPTIEILLPTPPPEPDDGSATYTLGRPIAGVDVGLRLDTAWRSYITVIDTWTTLFELDGAKPRVLWTGDHAGPNAAQTRSDLEDWSRLVECGVVGLGN